MALKKEKVVPDVIDIVPKSEVIVVFPSGARADQGNILTPTEVKDPPNVAWEADDDKFYTICMTDPDAPSRKKPKMREWQHWLVVNIPGGNISEGEVLTAYVGSAPPKGTGLHRYVIVVFQQAGRVRFDEMVLPNNSDSGRAKFSLKKFAKKYNLGKPIAADFFQAEWDEYVPIVYQQLGAG